MKRNNLPIVLSIIILLIIIIAGASYAYFSAIITGEETTSTIKVQAGIMKITYENNSGVLTATNFKPNDTTPIITKSFSVHGINTIIDEDMSYRLMLTIDNSFFTFPFKYELEHDGETLTGMVPVKEEGNITYGTYVLGLGHFENTTNEGLTHNYTLKLYYPEAGVNQNQDQGKEMAAHITIDDGTGDMPQLAQLKKAPDFDEDEWLFVNPYAFWQDDYIYGIKNIYIEDRIDIPENIPDNHQWDIGEAGNGNIMAYVKEITGTCKGGYFDEDNDDVQCYNLYIQSNQQIYANPNSSFYYTEMYNLDSINNIEKINYITATNMYGFFSETGYNSTILTLDLGDKFDTSNVTDMNGMFLGTGYRNTKFTLNLGDKFDTSKVTDMSWMFSRTGLLSEIFTLDLGDKFDTSKVLDMSKMFLGTGNSNPVFTLDLGNKFDTSKVTYMTSMFESTGYSSTTFTLDLGDKFDTSNVTDMHRMFERTGYSSTTFTLDLGDKFDTSNVTDMSYMFTVTGRNSTIFTLDLGDKFNTSNVTNMDYMFSNCGRASSSFSIDASGWNVNKVTSHTGFNTSVTDKVIPPVWVN